MNQNSKTALITGITGQDGSYLTELLLQKGYVVHGIVRRTSNLLRSRIEHLRRDPKIYDKNLFLHYGDLSDTTTLGRIVREVGPTEITLREPLIPAQRTRYLAEIAEEIEQYNSVAQEQAVIASKLYQVDGALKILQQQPGKVAARYGRGVGQTGSGSRINFEGLACQSRRSR